MLLEPGLLSRLEAICLDIARWEDRVERATTVANAARVAHQTAQQEATTLKAGLAELGLANPRDHQLIYSVRYELRGAGARVTAAERHYNRVNSDRLDCEVALSTARANIAGFARTLREAEARLTADRVRVRQVCREKVGAVLGFASQVRDRAGFL